VILPAFCLGILVSDEMHDNLIDNKVGPMNSNMGILEDENEY